MQKWFYTVLECIFNQGTIVKACARINKKCCVYVRERNNQNVVKTSPNVLNIFNASIYAMHIFFKSETEFDWFEICSTILALQ